jgi:hypothetical protein
LQLINIILYHILSYNKEDRKWIVSRNVEVLSPKNYYRGNAIGITYYECAFLALGIQHAMHMRRVILWSVACPNLQYFSILYHKRHNFRQKNLLKIKRVFWLSMQLSSEKFGILRRIQRDIILNVHRTLRKVSIISYLLDFNETCIYSIEI